MIARFLPVLFLGLFLSAASASASQSLIVTGGAGGQIDASTQRGVYQPALSQFTAHWHSNRGNSIIVDAGYLFGGRESSRLTAAQRYRIARAAGYDALNLTPAMVLEGLSPRPPTGLALFSCNVLPNAPVEGFSRSVVLESNGFNVFITGVSLQNASGLPDGWRWQEPLASLQEVSGEVPPGGMIRVLMVAGKANAFLQELYPAINTRFDLFFVTELGSLEKDALPENVFLAAATVDRSLVIVDLTTRKESPVLLSPESPSNAGVESLLAVSNLRMSPRVAPGDIGMGWPDSDWTTLPQRNRLNLRGENRAFRLSLQGAVLSDEWQEMPAPEGSRFLVLDTEFESLKPSEIIQQEQGQRALLLGSLHQSLFLIANGQTVIGPYFPQRSFAGALRQNVTLSAPRDVQRGDAIFLLPNDLVIESLEFVHYHLEYAPITLSLTGSAPSSMDSPAHKVSAAGFFEFGIPVVKARSWDEFGLEPLEGMKLIELYVVGRSLLTRENPANHFMAGADRQSRVETGRPVVYLEASSHLMIVSDEGTPYGLEPRLPGQMRDPFFLPDRWTQQSFIFRVPETLESFQIQYHFPNLGTVTGGMQGFAPPVVFPKGHPFDLSPAGEVKIDLGLSSVGFKVTRIESRSSELWVEFEISNSTDNPGFLNIAERITLSSDTKLFGSAGPFDSRGNALVEPMLLPVDEIRRVWVSFSPPKSSGDGLLTVSGVEGFASSRVSWDLEKGSISATGEVSQEPPAAGVWVGDAGAPFSSEAEGEERMASVGRTEFEPEVIDPTAQFERIEGGPEAALVIRVGDVDNLGFGWPEDFDLFGGESTPIHPWPWRPSPEDAPGTDRIMVGSALGESSWGDGYHATNERFVAEPVIVPLGQLPEIVGPVYLQIFMDDLQPKSWGSKWVLSLNGQPMERVSALLNVLDQSGPIGKLITLLLPEEFEWVSDTDLEILIDDSETGVGDGYAIDFVRLLIGAGDPLRPANVEGVVRGHYTLEPLAGVRVSSGMVSALTGDDGTFRLENIFAGLVVVEAERRGYLNGYGSLDVKVNETGFVEIFMIPIEEEEPMPEEVEEEAVVAQAVAGTGQIIFEPMTADWRRFYFILDASGSMLAPLEGRRKFDLAVEAINRAIAGLNESDEVALRIFGHRKRAIEEGADEDTALELPMTALSGQTRTRVEQLLRRTRPRGKTPLTLSLEQAIVDISDYSNDAPLTVVLLSDGADDAIPRREPAEAVAPLRQLSHVDLRIIVFDVNNPRETEQLSALRAASGGRLITALTADALFEGLEKSVGLNTVPWEIRRDGDVILSGEGPGSHDILEGRYELIYFPGTENEISSSLQIPAGGGVVVKLPLS
jgi:hypothetical protein